MLTTFGRGLDPGLGRPSRIWRYDPVAADQQDVRDDQRDHDGGEQDDVEGVHLAEVGDVEVGADSNRVEPVLALARDPLRVEVLLREIAGERGSDRDQEHDRPRDPGSGPSAPPGAHEELSP